MMITNWRKDSAFYGIWVGGGICAIITSVYFLGNLYLPTVATINSVENYKYTCSNFNTCSRITVSLSYNVTHKLYNGTILKEFNNPWEANSFINEIGKLSLIEIYYNRYDPNIWYFSVFSDPLMVILSIGLLIFICCTIGVIPCIYQSIKENEFLIEMKNQEARIGLENINNNDDNKDVDNAKVSEDNDKPLNNNNIKLEIQPKEKIDVELANKCQICLDLKISAIAECGHVGCHKCLTTLLAENKDCPFCRAKIVMIRPVFLN